MKKNQWKTKKKKIDENQRLNKEKMMNIWENYKVEKLGNRMEK